MNTEALETAITEIINALGIPARPWPQYPANYTPEDNRNEVLVRYVGTRYTPMDVSGCQKDRRQMVKLVVVGPGLRGSGGIYSLLDQLREKLEGFTFPNAGGTFEMEAEDFIDEYNSTWQFCQRWNLNSKQEYEQQDDYADRPISAGN